MRLAVSFASLSLAALLAGALPALAGGDDGKPIDRGDAQRAAKAALSETKLGDDEMGAMFVQVEGVISHYADHVMHLGPAAARDEDPADFLRAELEPLFTEKAVAVSGQNALLGVATQRAKLVVIHAGDLVKAQAKLKDALSGANLDDDDLAGSLFQAAQGFTDELGGDVQAPGGTLLSKKPAADVIKDGGFKEILAKAELSDGVQERMTAALADWLEAGALLHDDAEVAPGR